MLDGLSLKTFYVIVKTEKTTMLFLVTFLEIGFRFTKIIKSRNEEDGKD